MTFDSGLYLWFVGLARTSPGSFDRLVLVWSGYGLLLFAALTAAVWWSARGRGAARMAQVLCMPFVVTAAYGANMLLKLAVHERRPCQALTAGVTLEACPVAGDWSFPSNHAVIAAAAATVLLLVHRRIGVVASVAAVAMALSRVWVGAHYPHDVAAGLVVGAAVAYPLARAARRGARRVARLRRSPLRPLVARTAVKVPAGTADRAGPT